MCWNAHSGWSTPSVAIAIRKEMIRCGHESCWRKLAATIPAARSRLWRKCCSPAKAVRPTRSAALSLLKSLNSAFALNGALGQLYLEGKLVPRDVQEAVRLIGQAGQWDFDMRQQGVRLLRRTSGAVREQQPEANALLRPVEAASELGEPGAMAALIDLKWSENSQFHDRPGACKLIETAASSGDRAMAERLAECRAN